MSGDDGLRAFRKEADAMLSREARLEDMELVARLLAELAALRAKADAADRVRKLCDGAETWHERWSKALPTVSTDRLRAALDGPSPC